MFIGHFGVGLATKKISPKPSLGTLFIAAQFIDLIWPFLILFGIEKVKIDPGNTAFTPLDFIYYPFSHSLIAAIFWALLFGLIYYLIRKNKKAAIVLALLVISHWILDLITHRPDLPLYPGSNIFLGLGLWNSIVGTVIVEGLIFLGGIYLYLKTTKAKNKVGTYALWGLFIFLIIIYVMNLTGSPPPDAKAIGYVGLSQWLIVLWGYWIDRNRIYVTANKNR